jgi:hypothetical protein
MVRRTHIGLVLAVAVLFVSFGTVAQGQEAGDPADIRTIVKRGLTGEIGFAYDGPALQADPHQDLTAPMLLRLERGQRDGTVYTARFIGVVEGDYDLRTLIQHVDGSDASDLGPIVVRVVSDLPAGMDTDLFNAADPTVELNSEYVRNAIIIALVWLAIPVILIARRLMRPKPVDETPIEPAPPTLAEQLRPLVEAVAQRQLSVREQGRLELLLYHHWQTRLQPVPADMAACIHQIREHPEAGVLLRAIEGWLHRPGGEAHKPDDLDALLAPYREAPAIAEDTVGVHRSAVSA